MNKNLDKIKELIKKPKVLVAVGICGILLVFLSNFLPKEDKAQATKKEFDDEAYLKSVSDSVKNIVSGISGDKKPTVVVTLDSSVRYSYADSGESNTVSTQGSTSEQNSEVKKRSYVTVKDSAGGESPLLITETMPQIRGVAIICNGGDDEVTAEKIKNAVIAALDINSKRVYISGGN